MLPLPPPHVVGDVPAALLMAGVAATVTVLEIVSAIQVAQVMINACLTT